MFSDSDAQCLSWNSYPDTSYPNRDSEIKFRHNIIRFLNYFEHLNSLYKNGDDSIDWPTAERLFYKEVELASSCTYLNSYVAQLRKIPLKYKVDSDYAGRVFDAIYIWARRYRIDMHDTFNKAWEKYYYLDEAKGEQLFLPDTIRKNHEDSLHLDIQNRMDMKF